jgi:ubiquinone/menaquinone biosynthesis C-methylase UbiE
MSIFKWIENELSPVSCSSTELIYDDMESQSCRQLPVIYQPFDAARRMHWRERGFAFDFLHSTSRKNLLDFGPGDGWPSLIVAPFVERVVGVDASLRRSQTCSENAARLGIANAEFVHVPDGEVLPFEDDSFDGIMAASSLEESPNIEKNARELHRVLKPGGRMRIAYDGPANYRSGSTRDMWIDALDENSCRLLLIERWLDQQQEIRYGVTIDLPREEVVPLFSSEDGKLAFEQVTESKMQQLRPNMAEARKCLLPHPSGATLATLLRRIGFSETFATFNGGDFAADLFDIIPSQKRPTDMAGVDALLEHSIGVVVNMPADISLDPMITAVK